jgi:histone deacetylase 6
LCLQQVYNIEELNNVNPQSNLHKVPHDSFVGGDPPPEKFQTRDCYPIQNDSFKKRVSDRLMQLKFFTDLTFPVNRVCYVYDEIMLQHRNKFDGYKLR